MFEFFAFFVCDFVDSCLRFFSFVVVGFLVEFEAFAGFGGAVLLDGFEAAAAPKKLFIVFLSVVAHFMALSLIGEKGSSTNADIKPWRAFDTPLIFTMSLSIAS